LEAELLNIHALEYCSRVNGPGCRFVVWFQGCSLGCPFCYNPETHSTAAGTAIKAQTIFEQVKSQPAIEGITFSGGEPLQQIPGLLGLSRQIHDYSNLSMLMFTGYTWEEISGNPQAVEVVNYMDIVIAGRYHHQHRLASGLLGSTNKTIHFLTPRYNPSDLALIPGCEIEITSDGTITVSGIDPVKL
jgi:anaerobic ribonucleoside-triphosphate reductase activating protein